MLTKNKSEEDPNKIRNERGEITTNTTEIKNKNHRRILPTVICQQIGQPRRNG